MPSYSQPDPFTRIRGQFDRAGAPFTLTVVAANVLLFLADYFTGGRLVEQLIGCLFAGRNVEPHPWGILTYPLLYPSALGQSAPVSMVFSCYVFWWVGSSLERSWGTRRLACYFAGCSLASALCVWLGCAVLRTDYLMTGLWLVISAMIVTWAVMNRGQSVMLFVVSIPAMIFAVLEVALVYFVYFYQQPLLGLFGVVPCALAYFYANGNFAASTRGYSRRGPDLRMSRSGARRQTSVLDGSRPTGGPMGWFRAWQERRRLRKLWRDSGFGD